MSSTDASPVTLQTERCVLSAPRASDVDAVFRACQDPELQRHTTVPVPYTALDAAAFVNDYVPQAWQASTEYVYGIRLRPDAALMGVVAWQRERGAVGYWLGAQYRGRGVMTEAVRGLLDWVFTHDDVTVVNWEAVAGTIGLAVIAQRAGFRWGGEGACAVIARDGTRPWGWHGTLRREELGSVEARAKWPVLA